MWRNLAIITNKSVLPGYLADVYLRTRAEITLQFQQSPGINYKQYADVQREIFGDTVEHVCVYTGTFKSQLYRFNWKQSGVWGSFQATYEKQWNFKSFAQLTERIDLIESKSSWQTVFLSFLHPVSCEPNNNKTYFISRVLTRRAPPWLLFISIRHRTSLTLRSGSDRGVSKCLRVNSLHLSAEMTVSFTPLPQYSAVFYFTFFFPHQSTTVFQKPEGDGIDSYLLKPHNKALFCFVNFIYSPSHRD